MWWDTYALFLVFFYSVARFGRDFFVGVIRILCGIISSYLTNFSLWMSIFWVCMCVFRFEMITRKRKLNKTKPRTMVALLHKIMSMCLHGLFLFSSLLFNKVSFFPFFPFLFDGSPLKWELFHGTFLNLGTHGCKWKCSQQHEILSVGFFMFCFFYLSEELSSIQNHNTDSGELVQVVVSSLIVVVRRIADLL